jgi:hypothetical protein
VGLCTTVHAISVQILRGSNVGYSMSGAARAMTAECSHYETNLPDAVDEQADARKTEALQGPAGKDSKAYHILYLYGTVVTALEEPLDLPPRQSNFPRSLGL